ncbi:EmrB/QacA subfamily drug resistance transporter [Nocardia transvalensis]|uniref:EmrB/QacA subfamily drug resistance transporter n=1 Tax=Nocardia transvalensis TaxID=37333 RepID=A0A7W9ULP7_9NOCA|nr:DHA2 family efflux MFS transporter permease subunit [Nocardia transvalensis]MBB5917582.1 EmrB/QacA subfamily drug resistance transporter [Nocardia transvalensis]
MTDDLADKISVNRSAAPGRPAIEPRRVLLITSVATFVAFLDMSVVNVAFSDIFESFPDTALPTLSWVVSGYAVFFAAVLTPVGRYADVVGRKAVFLWSLLGFTVASALCTIAPSVEFLIAARCLQGVAAGGMIPAALGLVLGSYPPERRVAAVAAWAAASSAAAAFGPALGGLLVWAWDWRAVFLINVPVGILACAVGWSWLPEIKPEQRVRPDPVGAALVALGVGLVVVGLTQGGEWGWGSAGFLATTLGGVALLAAGIGRSLRHRAPVFEVQLWADRKFASASAVSFLFGIAMFAWLLACPLWTIVVWKYSIWEAGLANSPGAFTAAIGAGVVGKSKNPDIQRIATILGAVLFGISAVLFAVLLHEESRFLAVWLPVGLLSGLAIGLLMTAVSSAAATSLPPEKFASGYGMSMTARQMGGGLGIAAFAAITTSVTTGWLDGLHAVFWFAAAAMVPVALAALPMTGSPVPAATGAPGVRDDV